MAAAATQLVTNTCQALVNKQVFAELKKTRGPALLLAFFLLTTTKHIQANLCIYHAFTAIGRCY